MTASRPALPLTTIALILGLAGCGAEPTCTGDWCGTTVIVSTAEADVLLPPASQTDVGMALGDLIFSRLADVGPDFATLGDSGFVPQLAESWIFEDLRTLKLTLNPAARWHDGTPVTAADVAFSFDVYRDPALATVARSRLQAIASVTAQDERTAAIRYHRAYPEMFFDAVYHVRILPKHLLDTIPRDRLAAHPFGRRPVGSGPYRFVRWTTGESIDLAADSTFFLGRPGLRRVIWRFTGDPATRLTQLLAGEADVVYFIGGAEDIRRVEEADHLRVVSYPSSVYSYVGFNTRDPDDPQQPHWLFRDHDVRVALTMAIDREAVVRAVLRDRGRVPPGPISPALWIWSEELEQLPYDTAAARRLLAARGWTDRDGDGTLERRGQRLAFDLLVPNSSTPRRRAARIMQDQLKRVGVAMTITELEFNAFVDRSAAQQFDATFQAYGGEISPNSVAEVWSTDAIGALNYTRYSNPTVDRLLAAAAREADIERARAGWHAAVAAIVRDAPAIWIYTPTMTAGVHRRFENVTFRPDIWSNALWTWRVPPSRLIDRDRFAN